MQAVHQNACCGTREHIFEEETFLTYSLDKVFAFFSDAKNLAAITPPSLRFHILTPLPIEMKEGAIIEYRLRLFGIPFTWRTLITSWNPMRCFTDAQVKGPYRKWVHTHSFEETDGGVMMRDRVEYVVPGGLVEPIIHKVFVRPQVNGIFAHRSKVLSSLLGASGE